MKPAFAKATAARLLFATTNPNKLKEVRLVLEGEAPHEGVPYEPNRALESGRAPLYGVPYELLSLDDVGPVPEPDESGTTFWENARIKAVTYSLATGLPVVAEDSGLEIDALGGDPGVHSARFLGPDATYPDRFADIYRRLGDKSLGLPWSARFVTALAFADGAELLFETEAAIEGTIARAPAGINGFGYDPIFYYPPFDATTAQLSGIQKTSVSHRARSIRDFARFLRARPQ